MLITSGAALGRPCPICNRPGHACGDDHMQAGPVDNLAPDAFGGPVAENRELREYKWIVNNMETTGLLTQRMADRLGAVGVDEELPADVDGYSQSQNQAMLGTTDMGGPTKTVTEPTGGITGELATKPRRGQQVGIDEKGRTASARPLRASSSDDDSDNGKQQTGRKSANDADATTKARQANNKSAG